MKTEILFGIHPVFEAIQAGRRKFINLYVTREKLSPRMESLVVHAQSRGIPVTRLSPDNMKTRCGSEFHQGVGAEVSLFPFSGLGELLNGAAPFLLMLDSVVDTHNLGAIIRTALCVGVDGIVIPKDRSASPSPGVSRASAGAMEHVRIAEVTNLANTLREFREERNIWSAGLDMDGETSLFDSNLTGALVLVIGGEEKGIRPLVRKNCDFLMSIPQKGPLNSLNASVAGAVVMYEAFRQRNIALVR